MQFLIVASLPASSSRNVSAARYSRLISRMFRNSAVNGPSESKLLLTRTFSEVKQLKKREGFGSFHSADIEVLVREPEESYHAPEIYYKVTKSLREDDRGINGKGGFGGRLKGDRNNNRGTFLIDRDWTFINHGAFGGAISSLQAEANEWSILCERQPLLFFDRYLLPLVAHSLRALSKYLGCPAQELIPLPNVTAGLNSVISSVPLDPGDEVLCFSLTYGSTKKMLKQMCDMNPGAVYKEVHLPLPVGPPEDILERTKRLLSDKTRLVIVDQITSNTALGLPVLQICAMVKQYAPSAVIVVDAAHSIFSQPVNIHKTLPLAPLSTSSSSSSSPSSNDPASISLFADIWISNCHKWLACPKGAAVMWISPRVTGLLRPAIITHGFVANTNTNSISSISMNCNYRNLKTLARFSAPDRTLSGFAWDGCRNYSAFLTIPSALKFWSQYNDISLANNGLLSDDIDGARRGSAVVRSYCNGLINEAVDAMKRDWNLDEALFSHESLTKDLPMRLVPLPALVNGKSTRNNCTDVDAFNLQEELHYQHRIEVPIKCLEGRLYVRISAHVYNEISEYYKLIKVINSYT